jgi:predicted RND superfamily exporter protein
MEQLIEKYTGLLIRFRWWVMAVATITLMISVYGISRLSINTDIRVFFSKDNPQLVAFDKLENTYQKNDNVFIALKPHNGTIFTKETLSVISKLTEECWKIPHSHRVDSVTNFQHSRGEKDELVVTDLVRHPNSLGADEIRQIAHIALSEPLLVNRIVSADGTVAGINIDIIKPDSGDDVAPSIAQYVRNLLDKYRSEYPEIDFYLTGWIIIDDTMGSAAQQDMQELIPIMFAVLVLVMAITMRSIKGTLLTLVVIILSMIAGLGYAGFSGIKITGPSSTAPSLILTLALSDSVHILLSVFYLMQRGMQKVSAIRKAVSINIKAIVITSVTTMLGFLSMNFSDAPPFRDLGNIVAFGIMAAFIYSVLLLPAISAIVLPNTLHILQGRGQAPSKFVLYSEFLNKYKYSIFIGMIILTSVISAGILRLELNDDFIRYFDERYEYRVDSEFVMNNLTGLYTIEYSLDSGKSKGIHDPEFLKNIQRFVEWYKSQPEVVHVSSLIPVIKKLNMNMHEDDRNYYRIPENNEYIAQYILLYELSLPFGHDLNNQINVDKSALRVTVSVKDVTANDVRDIDMRAHQWLRTNTPAYMHTQGTGLAMMYAYLSERNIKSMLGSTFGALLLISLILVVAFRSIKYGLFSMIPNFLPAITAFGVWGFAIGRIGMPAAVLVSLALGIVVDDTVHFISKYLHARRTLNKGTEESVLYAFETVGRALIVTTITLVLGFVVLAFSGYKPNFDMGVMTALIISFALAFDLILLPVVILITSERSRRIVSSQVQQAAGSVSVN